MAHNLYRQDGEVLYGVKDYIVDNISDIMDLPTDLNKIKVGSQAFVIQTSERYMLNSQGIWVKVNLETGTGGGGTQTADNAGSLTVF